ncbi:MAG: hypothetical protein IKK38_02955, partial [Spirochaetaceae bacterium]|nr:hypothetical protein [Spirochaetaceae bacterium]
MKAFFASLFADWTLVVEQAVAKRRLLRHFVPRNDGVHKARAVIASEDKSVIASEARHSSRYVIASEARHSSRYVIASEAKHSSRYVIASE